MRNVTRTVVVAGSLLLLGSFSTWLVLRPLLPVGTTSLLEGGRLVAARTLRDQYRLAQWEPPRPLTVTGDELGSTRDPFVEAQSGRLLFTVVVDEGNTDLWIATREEGGSFAVRPLTEVNSPFHDEAPALADGVLWFASDRPGGQGALDLWRSEAMGERFSAAENPGSAVNSRADETDPAPRPDSNELWFATNLHRGGGADFDLAFTHCTLRELETPTTPGALRSDADERDPAFSPDGSVLFFASDRIGGAGGFDLWRSFARADLFAPPMNVGMPNGRGLERGPALADDGFTLYFASDRNAPGRSGLFRTRTREIVPAEGPHLTALDVTILAFLVAIALSSWLARRWKTLDLFYKCLVASFILHVAFLWYSRRIDVSPEAVIYVGSSDSSIINIDIVASTLGEEGRNRRGGGGSGASDGDAGEGSLGQGAPELSGWLPGLPEAGPAAAASLERMGSADGDAPIPEPAPAGGSGGLAPGERTLLASVDPVQAPAASYERVGDAGSGTPLQIGERKLEGLERNVGDGDGAAAGPTRRFATSALGGAGPVPSRSADAEGGGLARAATGNAEAAPGPELTRAPDGPARLPKGPTPTDPANVATVAPSDRVVDPNGGARGGAGGKLDGEPGPTLTPRSNLAPSTGSAAIALGRIGVGGGARRGIDVLPGAVGTLPGVPRAAGGGSDELLAAEASAEQARGDHGGGPVAPSGNAGPAKVAMAPIGDGRDGKGGQGGTDGAGTGAAPSAAAAPPGLAVAPRDLKGAGGTGGDNGSGSGGRDGIGGPQRAALSSAAPSGASASAPLGGGDSGLASQGALPVARATDGGSGVDQGLPSAASREFGPKQRGDAAVPAVALHAPAATPGSGSGAPGTGGAGSEEKGRGNAAGNGVGLALAPASGLGSGGAHPLIGVVAGPTRASLSTAAPELAAAPTRARLDLPQIAPLEAPAPVAPAPSTGSRLYERRFGEAKQVAVREGGGSEETERAVLGGLRYLARVQRPKGFFGDASDVDLNSKYRDVRVGKTGLCVLAFLGAGHTPQSKTEFSPNVTRAIDWILSRQDGPSGHFGNSDAYSHGIATYALAECYAITKDEKLRSPLERALEHLLAMQQRDTEDPRKAGGWTYYYVEGPGFDEYPRASVSAWQVMALESAKVGGLAVPDDALAAARDYFLKSFDPKFGGFRYTHNPSWLNNGYGTLPASTPASMFVLSLLGAKEDSRVASAEKYLTDRIPSGFRDRGEDAFVRRGVANVYFWYYSTLALFVRGGPEWRVWNDALKSTLLPNQEEDGSWRPIDLYARRYAMDDDGECAYMTAMCVLMLEVYYRYFTPLLEQQAPKGAIGPPR